MWSVVSGTGATFAAKHLDETGRSSCLDDRSVFMILMLLFDVCIVIVMMNDDAFCFALLLLNKFQCATA